MCGASGSGLCPRPRVDRPPRGSQGRDDPMTSTRGRLLGTALAVVLAGAGQTGYANAATQGLAPSGCPPTIVALPLPSGMDHGDVLAVRGAQAAGAVADAQLHQHV